MSFTDYDDDSFYSESAEEMNDKIRQFKSELRRGNSNNLPSLDVVEAIVNYCIENGKYVDALEFSKLWTEYTPFSSEAWLKKGFALLNLNRLSDAEAALNKSLTINPLDTETITNLAIVYESKGKYQVALELIDKVLSIEPSNEEALFEKGIILESMEDYQQAISIFNYLATIPDYQKSSYLELGFCYNIENDMEMAEKCYSLAVDCDPFDVNTWYNLGVVQHQRYKFYSAAESYDMALAVADDFFAAWYNKGNTMATLGKFYQAVECYQEALKCKPNDLDTLYNLAGTMGDMGMYDNAISSFTKIIKSEPLHYQSYFGRGICYDATLQYKKAIKDFDVAISLKSDNGDIFYAKADALYNMGDLTASLEFYEKALILSPDNFECLNDYGSTLLELKRYNEAKIVFAELIRYNPTMSDAYYGMAKVEALLGKQANAIKHLDTAISLEPAKLKEFEGDKDLFGRMWRKLKLELENNSSNQND